MPSRQRKLTKELRIINKKFVAAFDPIKNMRRASQILSKGFYATSVGKIKKIMKSYISELGLEGVATCFEHAFETDKRRSILPRLRFYMMVGVFLEESHLFVEKPSILVQLFHILIIDMLRETEFTMEDLMIFEDRIEKTGNQPLKSIKELVEYLQSVEYEGRWAEKIASMSFDWTVDEETSLEAVLRKQEEEEERKLQEWRIKEWRRISKARMVEMERRLSRGRRGRRGGGSWTHRGGSWTHRGRRG